MNKRERMLTVLGGQTADRVPASFWYHFPKELTEGERCIQAHLDFYRDVDLDFIKIMSDSINYPLNVAIDKAEDWFAVKPLAKSDPFFTRSVERARRINEELNGECCTFYNVFSPFNVVRERPVFTERALNGRSWDETLMAHLRENEDAVKHAMTVIGGDMAALAARVIRDGHCDGSYQSVQGAEIGRMDAQTYARVVAPTEIPILEAANRLSPNNMLHMCSWAGNRNNLSFWKDYPCRVKNWGVGVEGVSLAQGETMFAGSVLMGGMDNRKDHPLYQGDRAAVRAAVESALAEMKGKPYILAADCTVPGDIDREHLRWVMACLREHAKA